MFGGAANTPNAVNLNQRFTMEIILHETNGLQIGQRHEDGYINLTQMAQANGKLIADYLRLDITKAFLSELSTVIENLGLKPRPLARAEDGLTLLPT
jgi:KilA-N domain